MVKNKRRIYCLLILMFLAASIFGCMASGKYGRLTLAGSDMTIEQLMTQWKEYHIFYAGVSVSQPNAILFDPRGDDRVITLHEYWAPVKNRSELSEIMGWMGPVGSRAALYKIMGPGEQVFGYIYMSNMSPLIRVVDEKTLWIGNMTVRNIEGASQN